VGGGDGWIGLVSIVVVLRGLNIGRRVVSGHWLEDST
jgi:hypothetical protein